MGLVVRLLTSSGQSPALSTFISPTGLAIIGPTRKWLHAAGSLSLFLCIFYAEVLMVLSGRVSELSVPLLLTPQRTLSQS